jgi:NAD(P)-dependent dehydrogenase (short-subunit alcohol dehydrogenase family)
MKLENKTIIVTGSGRGIGEYISRRLGREGANIVHLEQSSGHFEQMEYTFMLSGDSHRCG